MTVVGVSQLEYVATDLRQTAGTALGPHAYVIQCAGLTEAVPADALEGQVHPIMVLRRSPRAMLSICLLSTRLPGNTISHDGVCAAFPASEIEAFEALGYTIGGGCPWKVGRWQYAASMFTLSEWSRGTRWRFEQLSRWGSRAEPWQS